MLVGGGTSGSSAGSTRSEASASDAAITARVQNVLNDDAVLGTISGGVATSRGRVTLRGSVPTREDRYRAERLARTVSGVVGVDNRLAVSAR